MKEKEAIGDLKADVKTALKNSLKSKTSEDTKSEAEKQKKLDLLLKQLDNLEKEINKLL